jgi:zinc protease
MNRLATLLLVLSAAAWLTGCGSAPVAMSPAQTAAADPDAGHQAAPAPVFPAGLDPAAPVPVDPAVRSGTLANGLTWFVRENHRPEQRASLFLVVGTGSVDEDDDQKGLAHMVEHMAFNGTENFPRHELIDYLESVGMAFGPEINAFTSLDQTVYMLQVPTDDPELLDTGLEILGEWAHRVSFEDEEIDKERGVIVEEWRTGLGAQDRIFDEQMPVLFKDSKYAERRTIGDMDVIRNHEHDTIRRYYRDWYRPDLQAVIAVGDFDATQMAGRIEELFGAIPAPAQERPRTDPPVPGHRETLYSVVTDPEATTTMVRLQWKHPVHHVATLADWRRELVIDLGTTMLRQRFAEISQQADPPFAMAFGGYRQQVRTMDSFMLMAITQEDKAERAVEALTLEAERVRRHGFTQGELDRARTELLRGLERQVEEADKTESRRWTFQYVSHFLYDQPIPGPEAEYELAAALLPTIEAEEVSRVLTGLMPAENRVVLVSGPEKDDLSWPDEAALAAVFAGAAAAEVAPYVDETVDAPLAPTTPAPVAIVERRENPELGTVTWTLANGVTVVVKPTDFKNDEVLMSAYAWGGTSRIADPQELRRIGSASMIVDRSGVGAFDPVALDKKLSGKVVSVSPTIGSLDEGFSGRCSPRDLDTLCQLVYLYATAPREDPEAFASLQNMMRTWLGNRDADPMSALRDTVSVRSSGGDPRERPVTVEDLDRVELAGSLDFYRQVFSDCDDLVFHFVGNVDPAALEPLARTWLGNLPGSPREDMWVDRSWPLPTGVSDENVVKGIEPKGNVQMVFQGEEEWSPEAEYALDSLVSALRIRTRQVVREEKSGTYGVRIGGWWQTVPRERYRLNLGWGCDPARVDELTGAIWDVIDEFQQHGPDEETLAKIRETQLREHETDLQENRYWLGQLERHHKRGTDATEILDISDEVAGLSRELIRDAARRYIHDDRYVRVVLLPEATTQ